jgi:tetratricopeptide (TPR) repeat protein
MAARAALALQSQQPAPEPGQPRTLDPQVADLFRKAVKSLEMVLDAKGQESLPQYVQSVMAAHIQLGQMDEAIALGQRGTQYFPRNAQVRSQLANAYNQAGQVDQAIATLHEALDLNPDLPNAYARMGQWLLAVGRLDEAAEAFKTAVDRGEQPADQFATLIFGYGYNTLDQKNGDLDGAIAAYNLAREFDISPALRSQINFFHGYALYRKGEAIGAPQTLESAQASLPIFQNALSMFNQARDYGDRNPGSNLAQFIEGSNTYIQIQQSIIQRGH